MKTRVKKIMLMLIIFHVVTLTFAGVLNEKQDCYLRAYFNVQIKIKKADNKLDTLMFKAFQTQV